MVPVFTPEGTRVAPSPYNLELRNCPQRPKEAAFTNSKHLASAALHALGGIFDVVSMNEELYEELYEEMVLIESCPKSLR